MTLPSEGSTSIQLSYGCIDGAKADGGATAWGGGVSIPKLA